MNYTVLLILQAWILEWIAVPFSRGFPQPRDWTQVSHIAGGFFASWATWEVREESTQGVKRGGKAFGVHSSWNINGTSAAQMVQPKAAQEEINPRTPATSPLGKWWSPSNAGVPAPTPWSWEEHGAWAGHPHALHSWAGPVPCPHVMHFHFPRNKELQWAGVGVEKLRLSQSFSLNDAEYHLLKGVHT